MEVEQALSMSLDDIISKQKSARPAGGKKQAARSGQQPRHSPKVFTGAQGSQRSGQPAKYAQSSNKAAARKSGTQKSPAFAMKRRPTQNGAIAKPARKGPNAQSSKGKQSAAPKIVPGTQALKHKSSMNAPLKITIQNDRSQMPVMLRAQSRPIIPVPQSQLVMPSQAQSSRLRPVNIGNGYAPSVRQTDRGYQMAAQPVRQTYQDTAGRGLNDAASYLRDPYRGDDFQRTIGGMRSDVPKHNRTQRDTRAYDTLLDDSLREDEYDRPRTNSYSNGRQENRVSRRNSHEDYSR